GPGPGLDGQFLDLVLFLAFDAVYPDKVPDIAHLGTFPLISLEPADLPAAPVQDVAGVVGRITRPEPGRGEIAGEAALGDGGTVGVIAHGGFPSLTGALPCFTRYPNCACQIKTRTVAGIRARPRVTGQPRLLASSLLASSLLASRTYWPAALTGQFATGQPRRRTRPYGHRPGNTPTRGGRTRALAVPGRLPPASVPTLRDPRDPRGRVRVRGPRPPARAAPRRPPSRRHRSPSAAMPARASP